jgi:hypothetical protein
MPSAAEVNVMTSVNASRLALSLAIVGLLSACGGKSSPAPAPTVSSALAYTNPWGGGWRLVKDPSSTPTRVVLNLVGPTGAMGRGVGFNLRSDGTVKFAKFANGSYINDLGVFQLTNKRGAMSVVDGMRVTKDVGAIVGGVKEQGRVLSVGAFQKDRRWAAQSLEQPLYQIAIALDPDHALPVGTVIPLTVVKARSIPENIGDSPEDPRGNPVTWIYNYQIDDVQITVGSLVTQ